MEQSLYRSPLPYPKVQVEAADPYYARIMLSNLGGPNSEMTAVSLYFYNNLVLEPHHAEVAQLFHQIMLVEMHHLQIFGQLALQLGADPRLWQEQQRRPVYWSPRYNRYHQQLRPLLLNALQEEQAAIEKYQRQAARIVDEDIVANLQRIIRDEQLHVDIFENLLRGV